MKNTFYLLRPAVIVSALGYFVDVFDLLLFGVVRVKSLTSLGYSGAALTNAGILLQNWQMVGMLVGGILTGILGDKRGRVKALYISIAIYSVANILNGFAADITWYAACRFLAGLGLAGEVGAGITLVAESLPKEKRGIGTTLVASFGISGAVAAGAVDWLTPDWHAAYFLGGGLGFLLLMLRLSVTESAIFNKAVAQEGVNKGDFLSFFTSRERFCRLAKSTLLGITTWFNTGILLFLAPEFGLARGISTTISAASAVIWFHIGMVSGDMASGFLSQYLKSRIRAIQIFLILQTLVVSYYLFGPIGSALQMYVCIMLLGFAGGYWAVFITNAAEQFGTNIRATAASAIPSLVRGLFIPISMAFQFFKSPEIFGDTTRSALLVGGICLTTAFWASFGLKETFSQDLDYLETKS